MTDTVTLLHAADIHLDSPLRGLDGLGDPDVVTRLRQASREALGNLVDLAIDRRVDALIIAGDTYDGDSEDFQTGRFFVRAMGRLHDEGIPVLMVAGNHDAESVITRTLTLPSNVFVFPTDRPSMHEVADIGVVFHGQGFPDKAVKTNLLRGYAPAVPGSINVGILHTSLGGYARHDTYAPCSVQELAAKGYDYFALGHIHKREVLATDDVTAAFCGNLQGRHIRETGAKGAYLVTVAPDRAAELEFVELDVARWDMLTVDISTAADFDEALGATAAAFAEAKARAGPRVLATRVTLVGSGDVVFHMPDPLHLREEITTIAEANGAVLQKVVNRVEPPPTPRNLTAQDRAALLSAADAPALSAARLTEAFAKLDAETAPFLRDAIAAADDDVTLAAQTAAAARDLLVRTETGR